MTPEPDAEHRAWRKAQRQALLDARCGVDPAQHGAWSRAISRHLLAGFALPRMSVLAAYWPFKGEFDPRFVLRTWRAAGVRTALPVVLQKEAPLQFRQWWPGVATHKSVYDLPVPEDTAVLVPDVALIPPVGFDASGYRLGYGAGYYDRTLAALAPQPLKIGVAFELSRMASIRPQAHDIAMDYIVTEVGIHHVTARALVLVTDHAALRTSVLARLRQRADGAGLDSGPR